MPEEPAILSACKNTCNNIFQSGSYFTEGIIKLVEALPSAKKEMLLKHLQRYQVEIEKDPIMKGRGDQDKFIYLFYTVPWKESFLLNSENKLYPEVINIVLKSAEQNGFHKSTPVLGRQGLSPFMIYMAMLLTIKNTAEKSIFLEKLAKKSVNFNDKDNAWGNTYLHILISNADSLIAMQFLNIFLILIKIKDVN